MNTPYKMKGPSLLKMVSALKHDEDYKGNKLEEHAHSESKSRSSRGYITISGKRGESKMPFEDISTGHSSTEGTYDELREKADAEELAKIRASQKENKKKKSE